MYEKQMNKLKSLNLHDIETPSNVFTELANTASRKNKKEIRLEIFKKKKNYKNNFRIM